MSRVALLLWFALFVPNAVAQDTLAPSDWQTDCVSCKSRCMTITRRCFAKPRKLKFDSAVESLHDEIPKLQPHEIAVGFARLIASFGYGHTEFDLLHTPVKFHRLPIHLYEFEDGVYVQGTHQRFKEISEPRLCKLRAKTSRMCFRPSVP